jgi:hypothetical protein
LNATKKVYLCCPNSGQLVTFAAKTFYALHSQDPAVDVTMDGNAGGSLLTQNFNHYWAQALDLHDAGDCTHFVMHHADIAPEDWWLDKMLGLIGEADILSAVPPIKDWRGLTSIAIGHPTDWWNRRRLTLHEIHQLPATFTARDVWQLLPEHEGWPLLPNTGLLAVKLGAWCDGFHFHIADRIVRRGGKRVAQTIPEDWWLGRHAHRLGLRVACTRAVSLMHFGTKAYRNDEAWGSWKRDESFFRPEDGA